MFSIVFWSTLLCGQTKNEMNDPTPLTTHDSPNLLKFNLTSLIFRNFGFQYERAISNRQSIAISGRLMSKGKFPFHSFMESYLDNTQTIEDLNSLQIKGYSISPEYRFYLTNRSKPNTGLYLAPFLSYNQYELEFKDLRLTIDYNLSEFVENADPLYRVMVSKEFDLEGAVHGTTAGVLFGAQWDLGSSIYLDWWILGASYGVSTGKMSAMTTETLTPEWQNALQERLDEMGIPMVKMESKVHNHGAESKLSGPWANVKMGIALGIRF